MARDRSRIPLLTSWNPANRQHRHHRHLDAVRENLALIALSPVDDGSIHHITQVPMSGIAPLADQEVSITGENFLQDSLQAEGTSDTGTNAGIDWYAIRPGADGNDITITMDDDVAHAAGPFITAVGDDVTVGYDSVGAGHDASDVVLAAADVLLNTSDLVNCTLEAGATGAVAPTDAAEVELSGGAGQGEFALEPTNIVTQLMDWSAHQIDALLDLSGYSDGDVVEIMVIADGIERFFHLSLSSVSGQSRIERGGAGYGYLTGLPVAAETFTITDGTTLETFTFVDGAPAAPFEVQRNLANAQAVANALITAINTDSVLADAVIGFNSAAGQAIVCIVPKDAEGLAGNLVLDATGVTNMTDQDLQGGAADAFQGAFTQEYTVSAQDVARWADGGPLANWVPVGCFPFTAAPNLYGICADRAGNLIGVNGLDYRVDQAGVAGYFALSLYDSLGLFQQNDIVRFILGE